MDGLEDGSSPVATNVTLYVPAGVLPLVEIVAVPENGGSPLGLLLVTVIPSEESEPEFCTLSVVPQVLPLARLTV